MTDTEYTKILKLLRRIRDEDRMTGNAGRRGDVALASVAHSVTPEASPQSLWAKAAEHKRHADMADAELRVILMELRDKKPFGIYVEEFHDESREVVVSNFLRWTDEFKNDPPFHQRPGFYPGFTIQHVHLYRHDK